MSNIQRLIERISTNYSHILSYNCKGIRCRDCPFCKVSCIKNGKACIISETYELLIELFKELGEE